MFRLVQTTVICCCLLRICNGEFGAVLDLDSAVIETCPAGTVTLDNPQQVDIRCIVVGPGAFMALDDNDVVSCTTAGCTLINNTYYSVKKIGNEVQLTVTGNFRDKIAGTLTCGDIGADGERRGVDSCTVTVNEDGGWATWSGYGSCTVTCAGGFKTRTRTCSNPAPFGNGKLCSGPDSDSTSCNTQNCLDADEMLAQLFNNTESFTELNLRHFLRILEDVGPAIANTLDFGEVMTKTQTNIESVFIRTYRKVTSMTYQFSDGNYFYLSPINSFNAVPNVNNDTSVCVCAVYIKNIENLVYDLSSKSDAVDVTQRVVNSQVMVIAVRVGDVYRRNLQLSQNISLTLKMKNQGLTQPVCVSFNAENLSLTSSGCYSQQLNSTHVRCICSHLTGFASLMKLVKVEHAHPLLDKLSLICLSLSSFCLLLTFLTFCGFSKLRWSRYFTLANVSLSLGLAQVLCLFGMYEVSHKVLCAVIAGFLHFWFLAAFCWMGVEAFQIYSMLVIVYVSPRNMIPIYVLIGYGVPTIIVAISAGLRYDGYGLKTHCWLSFEGWFHMAFIGPVVVIIIWNSIMLFIAMMKFRGHLYGPSFDRENLKKQLKGALTLLAVLGIAWLFGLVQANHRFSVIFSYIFVLLNATQGVFIFLFQCLLNNQVMTEYYQAVYKSDIFPARCRQTLLNILSKGIDDKSGMAGTYSTSKVTGRSQVNPKHDQMTADIKRVSLTADVKRFSVTADVRRFSLRLTGDDIPGTPSSANLYKPEERNTTVVSSSVDNMDEMSEAKNEAPEEKASLSNIPNHAQVTITTESKVSLPSSEGAV